MSNLDDKLKQAVETLADKLATMAEDEALDFVNSLIGTERDLVKTELLKQATPGAYMTWGNMQHQDWRNAIKATFERDQEMRIAIMAALRQMIVDIILSGITKTKIELEGVG